jgi:hypothetical protein
MEGSTTWVDMDGVSIVKKVWEGRANLCCHPVEPALSEVEWGSASVFVFRIFFCRLHTPRPRTEQKK